MHPAGPGGGGGPPCPGPGPGPGPGPETDAAASEVTGTRQWFKYSRTCCSMEGAQ